MVVIAGRLAATPEMREFESGTRMTRLLVVTRQTEPRQRVDVVPVMCWDMELPDLEHGDRVWVAGAVQRRFWGDEAEGRRSRIEVVAKHVEVQTDDNEEDDDGEATR
jgi:single-stranded DNA-binding protein